MKKENVRRLRIKEHAILGEPLPVIPLIEIAWNKRVLIENHLGIIRYGNEEINVKVRGGIICVLGSGLEIVCVAKEKIVICGHIDCVRLCDGGIECS